MVSFDHYQHELHNQLQRAAERGSKAIIITAAELRIAVNGSARSLDDCFHAINCEIADGDEVLMMPDGGTGLAVRFVLPRPGRCHARK